jgi:hypothetical protein
VTGPQPGQQVLGAGGVGVGQVEDELVAAVAAERVGPSQLGGPPSGEVPQQRVARAVSLLVVDPLEVVEVEHGDGQRLAGAQRVRQRTVGLCLPGPPVGQSGERIGAGRPAQFTGVPRLHLDEQGEDRRHDQPGDDDARRLSCGGAGGAERDREGQVCPGGAAGQEVGGEQAEGDDRRAQDDEGDSRRRSPGEQPDERGQHDDGHVHRPGTEPLPAQVQCHRGDGTSGGQRPGERRGHPPDPRRQRRHGAQRSPDRVEQREQGRTR